MGICRRLHRAAVVVVMMVVIVVVVLVVLMTGRVVIVIVLVWMRSMSMLSCCRYCDHRVLAAVTAIISV